MLRVLVPESPMAIYHLSMKTVARSKGRSATAAAAYRTAARIQCTRSGQVHDYRRRGGVVRAELVLPEDAPAWARDRAALWDQVEQAETRKNSTVAREFEVALPAELGASERERLALDFARALCDRHGMAVDVAVHAPHPKGDRRNHHAHLLCSTRQLGREGFGKKTRELDDQKSGEVQHWRAEWAERCNQALERARVRARVDHRSLRDQGRIREPGIHLGPNVSAMERRGVRTRVGDVQRVRERATERGGIDRARSTLERPLADVLRDLEARHQALVQEEYRPTGERVARVQQKLEHALELHEKRQAKWRQREPAPPEGLFSAFQRGAYEKAYRVYEAGTELLRRRREVLEQRLQRVLELGRKAYRRAVEVVAERYPGLLRHMGLLKELRQTERLIERERERAQERSLGRGRDDEGPGWER